MLVKPSPSQLICRSPFTVLAKRCKQPSRPHRASDLWLKIALTAKQASSHLPIYVLS